VWPSYGGHLLFVELCDGRCNVSGQWFDDDQTALVVRQAQLATSSVVHRRWRWRLVVVVVVVRQLYIQQRNPLSSSNLVHWLAVWKPYALTGTKKKGEGEGEGWPCEV